MKVVNNGYIVSDYKSHKVKFLDKNLYVTNSIGSYGKGPGDLNGPIQVIALQDSLFVFEEMNQRISVFDSNAKFSRHINNTFGGSFRATIAMSTDGKVLYCSGRAAETPLQRVDLGSLKKSNFGTYLNGSVEGRKPLENYHFILINNCIVAIAQADPVIKVYDVVSLELIHEVRYETIPIVKGTIDYIADRRLQNPSPNTTYKLVQDVSRYKNFLYLLVTGRENGPSCNHVVEFKIDGSDIQYERVIALDDGQDKHWYTAFVADNNRFLAFSSLTGCINQFSIQKTIN